MTDLLESGRTVARRWRELGLRASRKTETTHAYGDLIQLVADHMSGHPDGGIGQTKMKYEIAVRTGLHLKRYVSFCSWLLFLTLIVTGKLSIVSKRH